MSLIGIDLSATRILAVGGPAGGLPRNLQLDGSRPELPLVVSLEKRKPQVGRPGLAICRKLPHLICRDFLCHVGTDRAWSTGRRRLDAVKLTALAFEHLRPTLKGSAGAVMVVPGYLTNDQTERIRRLADNARWPLSAMTGASLAIAWSACMEEPWSDLAMVADVDDHALTWTAFAVSDRRMSLVGQRTLPQLGTTAWTTRLINAVADRCVRQSRRDPRESADAEQMLHDQLESACEACRHGRIVEFGLETEHWYQNLMLPPEDFLAFTAPLARRVADERHVLDAELALHEPARMLLITWSAARLPGLVEAVRDSVSAQVKIILLPAEAGARAAHELASYIERRELPRGGFDLAIPLLRGGDADDDDVFPDIDPILRTGF